MSDYIKKISENSLQVHPLLYRLDMELTERCNNNCIHCYINLPVNDSAKEKELTTKEIKLILTEAASLGCLTVKFTGGEPLLREDFEYIYLFARKLGMKVKLFTNAILITPILAELFANIPPKEIIEISVYGMSERSYETVTRVPGSFKAAMRGINLLLERNIPFVVKAAILPSNRDELNEFEAWASTIPWMKDIPVYSAFFDLRARHDSEERNKLIQKLRLSPEEGVKILSRHRHKYLQEMRQLCNKFMRPPGDILFSCSSGRGQGCVDAYGNFQPCMLLRHPKLVYDIRKGSMRKILTEFFLQLGEMKVKNPDYLVRCGHCFLSGLCEQCPARSWMEYGTLDTPVDYLCCVAHAQAVYLGLLQEGERAWEVEDWRKRIRTFVDASAEKN